MLSDEIGYSRQDVIYDKAGGCMNKIYENEYPIRVIDTDLFRLCRPSSLMDFMQESAMEHTVDLGISSEDLIKVRAIWMLVRMKYTIHRPIRGGEVLRIKTWGRRPTGVFVMRDYELYVGQERVGEAVSTWGLGDIENHSLLRAEDLLSPEGALEQDHPLEKLGKIRMPKDMEEVEERRIGYSETDLNGHANNTRYADYACDAIRFEALAGCYVKELQITYSAECLAGQTIRMLRQKQNHTYYVRGVDKDGKSHFDIRMELAEI